MKTTENSASVEKFVRAVPNASARQDCETLIRIMSEITGCEARMWGSGIVGFDTFHYRYANGKTGEICLIGFSPRKQSLVLYVTDDHERDADLLGKLGKIKTGQSCIYVKSLHDVHTPTLKKLIQRAVKARRGASAAN
ncbi:MAG TPA: DUF1801 domain-containing protein [Bryobacteraceae bacterium]|jgi:hypothetical protein